MDYRAPVRLQSDRTNIIRNQPIAAVRQGGGKRRFSRARIAAKRYSLPVHLDRARVQNDLLALMEQDAEYSAEEENWNVLGARLRFRRKYDLVAIFQQESRDVGNIQQKLFTGDLPDRPRCRRLK